ncbi:SHD1 domain-containing protein [Flammeovirga pacifica]|uniref:SHD1 domain-containing protein n=1 Tax=Flammeovirga pacifica TaxID=915059 RepID=UPI001A8C3C5B|nr:SHD1 domain-containing protein [Flammeovirga pacifica]
MILTLSNSVLANSQKQSIDDYRLWALNIEQANVNAMYLTSSDDNVYLEKVDGTIVKYPIYHFSYQDIQLIRAKSKLMAEKKAKMFNHIIQSKWLLIFAISIMLLSMVFMYHSSQKYDRYFKVIFAISTIILFVGSTSSYVNNFDTIFNYHTNISNKSTINKELQEIFKPKTKVRETTKSNDEDIYPFKLESATSIFTTVNNK